MKRKTNNFILILLLAFGAYLLPCCSSFVEVEPPQSRLLSNQVYNEPGTLEAALAGLYGELRDGNNGLLYMGSMSMSQYAAFSADEMKNYSVTSTTSGPNFYANTLFPDSEDILSLWNTAYKSIYYANAIIYGVEHATSLENAVKAKGKGEALFIRALLHFYLAGLFGDIPYVTSTDYQINSVLPRESVTTVYNKVVEDLLAAEALLGDSYPTVERVRVNKWVVRALLSRVYLYQQKWDLAEARATEVIDHTSVYKWVNDLPNLFLKGSTETIWAFKPKSEGVNSGAAALYRINPTILGFSLTQDFLNAFEAGDLRYTQWVGSTTMTSGASGTYYYPNKYKVRQSDSNINLEYLIIFRLTEQYLIRAEAFAQQGSLENSKIDLDKVRQRAGLNGTPANSKIDLLEAILRERRIELFAEFGHRWFDLKRTGRADEILGAVKPNWESSDALFPIPEKELLANPHLLPQNPGYGF